MAEPEMKIECICLDGWSKMQLLLALTKKTSDISDWITKLEKFVPPEHLDGLRKYKNQIELLTDEIEQTHECAE